MLLDVELIYRYLRCKFIRYRYQIEVFSESYVTILSTCEGAMELWRGGATGQTGQHHRGYCLVHHLHVIAFNVVILLVRRRSSVASAISTLHNHRHTIIIK